MGPLRESAASLVERRIAEGCLLPSLHSVSVTALRALEERLETLLPHGLLAARRDEALASTPANGVPESLIVDCVVTDSVGAYIANYRENAKRSLREAGVGSDGAWTSIMSAYWEYLGASSGIKMAVERPPGGAAKEAANRRKTVLTLLFRPTFAGKPLSKRPFKEAGKNTAFARNLADLRRALDAVQRYAYYMRPADPMNHSADTATRLCELLAYAATLYRWLLWLMDSLDSRVLRELNFIPSPYGPRECRTPDQLFERHMRYGPGATAGAGCATALVSLTSDALMAAMRISLVFSMSPWRRKASGVAAAVVAVVELVSIVHHHCQYLINMVMAGHVCWLAKGVNDPYLQAALRSQGRFCHFLGNLSPTATSHSWSEMETGTAAWFAVAVARAAMLHGGATPHYLLTMGSARAGADVGPAPVRAARRAPSPAPADRRPEEMVRSSRSSWRRRAAEGVERLLVRVGSVRRSGGRRDADARAPDKPQRTMQYAPSPEAPPRSALRRCGATADLPSACASAEDEDGGGDDEEGVYGGKRGNRVADLCGGEDDDYAGSWYDSSGDAGYYASPSTSAADYCSYGSYGSGDAGSADDAAPDAGQALASSSDNVYMEMMDDVYMISECLGGGASSDEYENAMGAPARRGVGTYSLGAAGRADAIIRLGPLPPVPDSAGERREPAEPAAAPAGSPAEDCYDAPRSRPTPRFVTVPLSDGESACYDVPRPLSTRTASSGHYDTPRSYADADSPEGSWVTAAAGDSDDEYDYPCLGGRDAAPTGFDRRRRPGSCIVRSSASVTRERHAAMRRRRGGAARRSSSPPAATRVGESESPVKLERIMSKLGIRADASGVLAPVAE